MFVGVHVVPSSLEKVICIIRQQLKAKRKLQGEKRHLLAWTHKSHPGRTMLRLVRLQREAAKL